VSLYAAIELSPGQAAEALSRLRDEGYLREVSGDLEFRNELIRAQAYYAVAGPTRQHLHRRVAELLVQSHSEDDKAINLEIAWHHLRGGDVDRAVPFAIEGAEAVLAVGAPHGAEEILKAIVDLGPRETNSPRLRLLLARALVDQSKTGSTLSIIEQLMREGGLTLNDQAEVAMLRASAEFLLNSEPGEKYCEVARTALGFADRTGDPNLISRALFECARAGTEQGLTELISIAEEGIEQLQKSVDISSIPVAVVTQAYCRLFRMDSAECLRDLQKTVKANSKTANAAQRALIYSAMGFASFNLCRLKEALDAMLTAFELSKRVGDDARMSLMASNLCIVQHTRGFYDEAVKWGEMSVTLGEASNSSALQMSYTNLLDAYVLVGRESAAVACMDRARDWLVPKRRWKFHFGFLVVSAAYALIRGNTSLALDIIGHLEAIGRDREEGVPMPGPYWKLRIFKSAHLGTPEEAQHLVRSSTALFRDKCPLHYLDVLAAKAWLETRVNGKNTPETLSELRVFENVGALGRRALLTAQGFLMPLPSRGSGDGFASRANVPVLRRSTNESGVPQKPTR
jgi:tetratricopeptide (TPR) repeat protein